MPSHCSTNVGHLILQLVFVISIASVQSLNLLSPNSSFVLNTITEWTAMGDSYASGIGAGAKPQDDPKYCFRCSNAYPELVQSGQGSLQPNPEKFNFVACSGAKFPEILDWQTNNFDRPGRPSWGAAPEFVTLTMGGNDVGILPLILTCIYSIPMLVMGCDAVIQRGFDILDTQDFKNGVEEVLQDVLLLGRTHYGLDFHIFVTGYAQLFNSETSQCDTVTFKPARWGLAAQFLTRERRTRMNELAVAVNRALETAVQAFSPSGTVTFVDYDALFEGHRVCDRFEPNGNDDETWFFEDGTTSDPSDSITLANDHKEGTTTNGTGKAVARYPLSQDLPQTAGAIDGAPFTVAAFSDYYRVFHPKSRGHQAIRGAIVEAIGRVQLLRGAEAAAAPHNTTRRTDT